MKKATLSKTLPILSIVQDLGAVFVEPHERMTRIKLSVTNRPVETFNKPGTGLVYRCAQRMEGGRWLLVEAFIPEDDEGGKDSQRRRSRVVGPKLAQL